MEELQRQIKEQRQAKALAMAAKKSSESETSSTVTSGRKVWMNFITRRVSPKGKSQFSCYPYFIEGLPVFDELSKSTLKWHQTVASMTGEVEDLFYIHVGPSNSTGTSCGKSASIC